MTIIIGLIVGSSPRVWGQDRWAVGYTLTPRIIPTRMGTRTNSRTFVIFIEDHPHAYGDKVFVNTFICIFSGSSPRVWGQVFTAAIWDLGEGIIPTRMGTSAYLFTTEGVYGDHPHAYGDKFHALATLCSSSRIIPTRMGTRRFCIRNRLKYKDHPHAYGDKLLFLCFPLCLLGSSPRVWGQDAEGVSQLVALGIIPTRMGTSTIL